MRLSNWKFESAKNGRIDAHGLNCKIFLNSELIFGIYDKNYLMIKFHVSPTIMKFSSPNLASRYIYIGLFALAIAEKWLEKYNDNISYIILFMVTINGSIYPQFNSSFHFLKHLFQIKLNRIFSNSSDERYHCTRSFSCG